MSADRDALIIFARAPELGAVKTRIAAMLGERRALEIYRELAEGVVEGVRDAAASIVVAYTPAGAGSLLSDWLGSALRYEPQSGGDLGDRMSAAIARRLAEGATRVIVIGTDCPELNAATVAAALATLDTADVVFGPALDGGYYLIGMRRLHDILFRGIPWSSDQTLAVSLERAAAAGLRAALLPLMRDIDTADDWHAHSARAAPRAERPS
jgi:rSAM/selenodomain-associated transferase 1